MKTNFENKKNQDWEVDYVEVTIQRRKDRDGNSRWVQKHSSFIGVGLLKRVYEKLSEAGYEKTKGSIDNLMEFYSLVENGYRYYVTLNFRSFNATAFLDIEMATR